MAHHPMFEPDPAKADFSAAECHEEVDSEPAGNARGESDLSELAAKFTAHGAGKLAPELSAELALEVVLNEIAEEACAATGGSGAAIVLARGGEWVCRASAGDNAPELGSRLDSETGLSGACVKTRTMQHCDDAQSDPRADIEACRNLGVRSVMILPLLTDDRMVGVFEVFSALPSAFSKREEQALEVLAQRVIQNLEWAPAAGQAPGLAAKHVYPTMAELIVEDLRAAEMSGAEPLENFGAGDVGTDSSRASEGAKSAAGAVDAAHVEATQDAVAGHAIGVLTWVLGLMVLSAAVLLAVVGMQRFRGGTMERRHVRAVREAAMQTSASGREQSSAPAAAAPIGTKRVGSPGPISQPVASSGVTHAPAPPAGGLAVYEKGKEIFRLPPQREPEVGDSAATLPQSNDDGVLHRVEPVYPEEARSRGIEGAVVADVFIDRDGKVVDVKTVSGDPLLAQAVSDAVKQWVFKPRSAPMETRVTLNFRLPH